MKFRSLNDCSRCMACKTSHKCVIDDDIRTIIESIRTSDCVVFSTPVFFNGPSALYKLVEDRMFSFLDKERNSVLEPGKKAVLIVTGCNPESRIDEVAKILANNLETIGFEILGVITYCDKDGKGPIDENDDLLVKAKKLGQTMRNTPTV